MKICIKNGTLISMSDKRPKIENNIDVLIDDNKIIKIEKDIKIDSDVKIIDAKGKIIMPGLINTHAHVPMSIFRETVDGYDLQSWLTQKIWPMEDKLTNEDIYYASYLTYIEMIKSGTTTINDMYFSTDSIIKAAIESGVRIQTTRTLIGSSENQEDLNKIDELDNLIKNNKNDRVTFNVGIHGLYTVDSKYLEECIKYAEKINLPIHMHFCENKTELSDIIKNHKLNPVEVIKSKFKNKKIILAHCVELEESDIKELSKLDISVSHCPVSNLKLGCGIAKIQKMQECGINVSLGTDGQGSGCNLDMFETMKFTALLQKGINKNPKLMNAYDILKMATINGAYALNLQDKIGSIEEDKLADIIIINIDDIKLSPLNDIISEIVYNVKSNNVETTIINGKILMENKVLINDNEKYIKEQCNKIIDRII